MCVCVGGVKSLPEKTTLSPVISFESHAFTDTLDNEANIMTDASTDIGIMSSLGIKSQ